MIVQILWSHAGVIRQKNPSASYMFVHKSDTRAFLHYITLNLHATDV